MNRRQKIIVSVIGIFIVLLALVGITYGYFLTRIQGNTNTTSITVTTADLKLVYADGTPSILKNDVPIVPSSTPIGTKEFTVTNAGNATVENYGVVLDDFSVVYTTAGTTINGDTYEEGEVTYLNHSDDMKLVITCESSKGTDCNGYDDILPTTNDTLILNTIEKDEVHTYTATLTFVDSGDDQSLDMNKTINGKFDIIDANGTVDVEGTLATYSAGDYVQINSYPKTSYVDKNGNYKVVGVIPDDHTIEVYSSTGSSLTSTPIDLTILKGNTENVVTTTNTVTITDESRTLIGDFNNSYALSLNTTIEKFPVKVKLLDAIYEDNELQTNTPTFTGETSDNGLYIAETDEGETHYFRGAYLNNYVKFGTYKTAGSSEAGSDMIWRIVRINEDNTIRLMLVDTIELTGLESSTSGPGAAISYDNYVGSDLQLWASSQLYDVTDKITSGKFCFDVTGTIDVNNPTFNCRGEIKNSQASIITADELLYAGTFITGFAGSANNFVFRNDELMTLTLTTGSNYNYYVLTFAASAWDMLMETSTDNWNGQNVMYSKVRPVINLKADVTISNPDEADGSSTHPYIVDTSA